MYILLYHIPAALSKLEAFVSYITESLTDESFKFSYWSLCVSVGAKGGRGWKERGSLLLFNARSYIPCSCSRFSSGGRGKRRHLWGFSSHKQPWLSPEPMALSATQFCILNFVMLKNIKSVFHMYLLWKKLDRQVRL